MELLDILTVLSRWIHILTAIVVLGGSVFMRFVLMPAADKISAEEHEVLRGHIMKTWKRFVHIGIALFVLSGGYNYAMVFVNQTHKGEPLYHALLGIKMLLALVVFFLASALVGRAAAFEKFRQNRKMWLGIIILLAVIVVVIGGYVKVWPHAAR